MAITSFSQMLANVKARKPGSAPSAQLGTARKNWQKLQARGITPKPGTVNKNFKMPGFPRSPLTPPPVTKTEYGESLSDVAQYDPEEAAREKATGRK